MNYKHQLQGPKYFKTTVENDTMVEDTLLNNDIIKLSKDGKGFSNNFTQTHYSSDWTTNKQNLWWSNVTMLNYKPNPIQISHILSSTTPIQTRLGKTMPIHFINVT